MVKKFKALALGAVLASALPVASHALTTTSTFDFFSRSLQPGDTFLTSGDPTDLINDAIFGRDNGATGSPTSFLFTFLIENDQADGQTVAFDLRSLSSLSNFTFSLDGFFSGATDNAVATLGAGESALLTLSFDNPTGTTDGRFVFDIASVPLPAGLVLMLTGLGGLAVARRRKSVPATA